jgi:tripartite ATP-independent transporter DctM subunit
MSEVAIGIAGLAAVILLFLTGIELSFAMAVIGFLGFSCVVSLESALNLLARDIFDAFTSYNLTVVPLFIFMGQIAFNAGIARRLYDSAFKFIGHIPGGLAMATVGGATAFKAICGSSPATAATFASVAIPEMDKYGYSKKLSTGIVASVGTLGGLIPPSVVLIIFGLITEQSIGRLFLGGLIPGLIIAFFFVVIIYGWCRINPDLGPKGARSTWNERLSSLPELLWVSIIFLVVVGGLMKGFFTPTEAGSVGTFAVLVLSIAKRDIDFTGFVKSIRESLRTACMVLTLVACSNILGHFLAVTKIPMLASDWVASLPLNRYLIIVLIILIYQLGGSFIEDFAFLILATPIFYPAVLKLGFDPLWFGILIAINLGIGVLIPPMALNVFIVRNITKVPFGVIYRGSLPFLLSLIVCAALLFIFPEIATFVPNLLMK